MNLNRRHFLSWASAAGSAALPGASPRAQAPDASPLTIVIPFAPGGASDLVARVLAEGLEHALGRLILVEHKGGAGGLLAATAVGRAAPDGNTLLYGHQGQMVVARHLFPATGPAPRSMLAPLSLTARTQFLLVVPAEVDWTGAEDLAAAGRQRRLRFGIPGFGSPPHLATVLLGEHSGASIDLIPYQGSAPLLVDLVAGRLDAAFDNVASGLPTVRAGRLRALGVSGPVRAAVAPDLPTLAESGIDGYAYRSWQGLFAPRGIDSARAASLTTALHRTLDQTDVRQRLAAAGLEVAASSPAELEALMARDAHEWDERVRKGLLRAA